MINWFSYLLLLLLLILGCKNDRINELKGSIQNDIFQCIPTIIRCDTLPQPEPIPLEFDDLEGHTLALGPPAEPLFNDFILGAGTTCNLYPEKVIQKIPGDGHTDAIQSEEIRGTIRKLNLPEEVEVQHLFSPRENALSFLSLGKLEGLLHNVVLDVCQDSSGNLWLASEGGLTKYDGRRIYNYTVAQGLTSNILYSVCCDSKNRIWIGTLKNGIDIIDGEKVTHYGKNEGFEDVTVLSLLEDKSGNMWIGTDGRMFGLWKFDGKTFCSFKPNNGLPLVRVEDIMEDHAGNIWVAGLGGITKFDGLSFQHFDKSCGLPIDFVSSIAEDDSHIIWLGSKSNQGLASFDGKEFKNYSTKDSLLSDIVNCIKPFENGELWVGHDKGITIIQNGYCKHVDMNSGLSSADIRDIYQDQFKQIWISTRAGITKFKGALFNHYSSRNGIFAEVTYAMAKNHQAGYWIGSGSGLSLFDGKLIRTFEPTSDFQINDARTIARGTDGITWFGSNSGLIAHHRNSFSLIDRNIGYIQSKQVETKQIFKVFADNRENIWLGTKHGLTKYDKHALRNFNANELGFPRLQTESNPLSADDFRLMCRVYDIDQDNEGNLWFAIWGYGLIKYDGVYFSHFNTHNGFPNKLVQCMVIDSHNRKWVGTEDGLICLTNETFMVFKQNNGLSNSNIQSLQLDHEGNLWIGTRDGLNKLNSSDIEILTSNQKTDKDYFTIYSFNDGLISIGVGRNCMYYDTTGDRLWMGGNNSLSVHFPEKNNYSDSPKISLTSLDLFNDKISWGEVLSNKDSSIVLSNGLMLNGCEFDSISPWNQLPLNASFKYNNNFLTFNFVGSTTYRPEQVKYQYMLDGWDVGWSGVTSRTSAPYGNLPSGNYTFMVKSCSSNGLWCAPLCFKFKIRPPWWKTWWAYTAYVLAALGFIAIYIRWRERELLKRQMNLELEVKEATIEIIEHRDLLKIEKEEVEKQKQRSDELLMNILPVEVADELKSNGFSKAKYYEEASVLFTDFKGFTGISENLDAEELVAELHHCFSAFDKIMLKYGLEKIKTIGDSYMAVAGVPHKSEDNAVEAVKAGQAIIRFMDMYNKAKMDQGKDIFEIRVGINTGPVIAGIVGLKKFQYDIWGDTVNTASRMESAGEPGKINISESTYALIKDEFLCEYRGEIDAKGKGKMKMYFVVDGHPSESI